MITHSHQRRPSRWLWASLLLTVSLSACQTVPTKTYEIRQRAFTHQPASLVRDYQEEYAYIEQRRQTVANGESNGVAEHVRMVMEYLRASLAWPSPAGAFALPLPPGPAAIAPRHAAAV